MKISNKNLPSHHSSTFKAQSKNEKVFASIARINSYVPKSFVYFIIGLFSKIVLMFIYFIYFKYSGDHYLETSFYPIQSTVNRYCLEYTGFATSTAIMTELEYQYLNLTKLSNKYDYNFIYYRIISRCYTRTKDLLKIERETPIIRSYQTMDYFTPTVYLDINSQPKQLKMANYIDVLEQNLIYLQEVLEKISNFRNISYDFLIYLQRTYAYFFITGAASWNGIKTKWMAENDDMNDNLKQSIIIFIFVLVSISFFTVFQMFSLYNLVNRLASIFLRCKKKDALREIKFIDNFLETYKKNEFCNINFAEQVFMRRKKYFLEESNNTLISNHTKSSSKHTHSMKQAKKQSGKYHSNSQITMKPIKKTTGFCFVLFIFIIIFLYVFLNYYSWTLFNSDIQSVISLGTTYSSGYAFSVTVLVCNNLYLREAIIRNPTYEYLDNSYQKADTRKAFFVGATAKRIVNVTGIFESELPDKTFRIKQTLNDLNFAKLIDNNICEVFLSLKKIEEDEFSICNNIWDGAFQKGILLYCY